MLWLWLNGKLSVGAQWLLILHSSLHLSALAHRMLKLLRMRYMLLLLLLLLLWQRSRWRKLGTRSLSPTLTSHVRLAGIWGVPRKRLALLVTLLRRRHARSWDSLVD